MLKVIGMLRSGTLRGLAIALAAYVLQVIGLAEQFPSAEGVIDGILQAIEILGIVYAAVKRTFAPNPPLTEIAVEKERAMLANGKIEVRR